MTWTVDVGEGGLESIRLIPPALGGASSLGEGYGAVVFGRREHGLAEKAEDKAWYPWDLGGIRRIERLARLRSKIYREWFERSDPVEGDLLLTSEHLVFAIGPGFTQEIELARINAINWTDDYLRAVVVGYLDERGEQSLAPFDLDVPPNAGMPGWQARAQFGKLLFDSTPEETSPER